jgi:DNA repair exonuclease SbcCD ATPase subunit
LSTRQIGILSLAFSVSLLPLGCNTNHSPTPDANEKIKDAEKATAEAARAKRDEFIRDMQKKLDEFDAKYKALEQRATEAKGDAKKDLDEKVKVAKTKRDAAAKKLDELKSATHDRWEKIKEGVGSALDDLKTVFE